MRSIAPDQPGKQGQVFDWVGALLLMASLLGLLLALTEGPIWGWGDARIFGLLALFVAAGAGFVAWELRFPQPMINLAMFRKGVFSLNLLAGFVLFLGLSFNLLLTPLFLQFVYGFDLQTTGLALMALPLTLSLTSPFSGRLSDRIGARSLTVAGLVLAAVALAGISLTTPTTPLAQMVGFLLLLGAGVGLFQSPNNSTVLGNAPPEALGVASGLLAVMRTLGQTAGIAVAGAIWSSQVIALAGPVSPITAAPPEALAGGFDLAMRVAAGLALLAIVPSLAGGRAAQARPAQARAD
jgi:MFS family permease